MLQDILKKDQLAGFLLKKSNITSAQLDTYIVSLFRKEENISLKEEIGLRDRRVSKGAFIRTLRQGQTNLERSLYTVILAEYFGILEAGSITKLAQVGSLLQQIRGREMKKEDIENITRQISHAITTLY